MVEFPIGLVNGKFSPRKRSLKKKEKNFFLVSISHKKKKGDFWCFNGVKTRNFCIPRSGKRFFSSSVDFC